MESYIYSKEHKEDIRIRKLFSTKIFNELKEDGFIEEDVYEHMISKQAFMTYENFKYELNNEDESTKPNENIKKILKKIKDKIPKYIYAKSINNKIIKNGIFLFMNDEDLTEFLNIMQIDDLLSF